MALLGKHGTQSANMGAFSRDLSVCLRQDFPIGEEKLIELAKTLHETGTGVKDDSLLAPDFRWLYVKRG